MSLPEDVQIILGSSSKTRQALLREMGYEFEVKSADIDERAIRRETPEELVMTLAKAKADAIIQKMNLDVVNSSKQVLLITADQVVVNEGVIREKPLNAEEARTFIAGYTRAPAITVSAVLVTNLSTGFSKGSIDKAEIYFHPVPEKVIDELIEQGSVLYAAGGLLVENPLVSPFVQTVIGSVDSVLGLPKELTRSLIHESLHQK